MIFNNMKMFNSYNTLVKYIANKYPEANVFWLDAIELEIGCYELNVSSAVDATMQRVECILFSKGILATGVHVKENGVFVNSFQSVPNKLCDGVTMSDDDTIGLIFTNNKRVVYWSTYQVKNMAKPTAYNCLLDIGTSGNNAYFVEPLNGSNLRKVDVFTVCDDCTLEPYPINAILILDKRAQKCTIDESGEYIQCSDIQSALSLKVTPSIEHLIRSAEIYYTGECLYVVNQDVSIIDYSLFK